MVEEKRTLEVLYELARLAENATREEIGSR
jgi:hypothetical protein